MINYPFQKLLTYLFAISQNNREEFAELVQLYLPSILFQYEDPYRIIYDDLENKPIPRPILTGKYTPEILNIFLKQQYLLNLHTIIEKEDFHTIIFDTDLRRKIDGMALSSVFRKLDIISEFSKYNTLCIETYLDCFANYKLVSNKRQFIVKYVGDKQERRLYERILENTSRQYLKIILGVKLSDTSPLEIINNALHVAKLKMETALLAEDDIALDKWMKMTVTISEKLNKIGAGNRRDIDELIEKLKTEPDFEDPIIYTKEELDIKYESIKKEQ